MEVSRKQSKRRPERAMYVTPGRRGRENISLNIQANQKAQINLTAVINDGVGLYENICINTDADVIANTGLNVDSADDVISIMSSQTEKSSVSEEVVVKILTSFCSFYGQNLDDSQKRGMESILITFSMFLMEHKIASLCIMEKLVVTLITIGEKLEQVCPKELDSLFTLMRNKFIEKDTSPDARRYLMSVIETRAGNWSMRHE